jgi:hypothetical protein
LLKYIRIRLNFWEIWNEPQWIGYYHVPRKDIGYDSLFPSGDEYTVELGLVKLYKKQCEIAYQVIKSIDPDAKVIIGAVDWSVNYENNNECIYSQSPYKFVKRYFQIGGNLYGDILSIHPYIGISDFKDNFFEEVVDSFRNLMRRYGWKDKDLMITEQGVRGCLNPIPYTCVSYETQASLWVKQIVAAIGTKERLDKGVSHLIFYSLWDGGWGGGIIDTIIIGTDTIYKPWPAYFAYLQAKDNLLNKHFNKRIRNDNVKVYEFEDPKSHLRTWVIWWSRDYPYPPSNVIISLPGRTHSFYYEKMAKSEIPERFISSKWHSILCDTFPVYIKERPGINKFSTAYNSQKKFLIDSLKNLHFVYHTIDDTQKIVYTFSKDEGENWEINFIGKGEYPSISLTNGINCLWKKDRKIYFRRKFNNNWQNEEIILTLPYYSNFVSVPCFVSYGDYGHVAVEVQNSLLGQWQLWYGKFNLLNPQEVQWSIIDRRGPPSPFSFSHPSIDVDGSGNLHLVYSINDTIFYRFKEENWSLPEVISTSLGNKNPSISFFKNYIDVVWEKEGEIYHRRKPVGGIWWEIENISNTEQDVSTVPVICGSSQCLWQERIPYGVNGEYLIRYSGFDGTSWSYPQNLSDIHYNSYNPAICLKLISQDSGTIYFVYTKELGNFYEIECRKKIVKIPYLISGEIKEDVELKNKIFVTGDVIVPCNLKLKILPNTKIYFYPNFDDQRKHNINLSEIIVYGKLIANGNENEKIKFSSLNLQKGSYGGIIFQNSKSSILNYTELFYAKNGININSCDSIKISNSKISENYHGIRIINSNEILIEKCFIENNKPYLNKISKKEKILEGDTISFDTLTGIYASNSKIILNKNKIIDNFVGFYAGGSLNLYSYGNYVKDNLWHGYDIAVSQSSNLIFESDTFINNGWYPREYNLLKKYYIEFAGVSLAHRYYSGISNIEVKGCYFKKNCDGIRIGRYGNFSFPFEYNIKINGNEFDSNFYAVTLHGGRVSHINSILTKNILKNSDSSNLIIAAPFDSARINLGNLENDDTLDDGENHILGSIYSIIDSSYYDIYAQGNLWDYSDSSLIDNKIYDDDENPNLSKVNFKYFYRAGEIKRDTVLSGEIRIGGDLIVPENVKLVIKEPAILKFAKNSDILKSGNDINRTELIIYGRLKFEGENEKIVLTSDGFIKEKGDFYGISFKGNKKGIFEIDESLNEHIKNIKIEYSLKGIEFLRENEKLKLMNSEIKNSNYGVYFDGKNLEIQNSKIYFSDTGIYILKGKGFIKETEVKENGVGILNKGDSEINIFKSYIMKNKIGIYIDENSTPRLKNGKNHICFNNLYNLYNNTIYDVEAQMNWWGTKNKDSISLLIYDFYDDSTKGKVYFEPIWFPKENISGVQGYEEIKGEFVKLKNTIFRNFAEIEIISFKDSKLLLKIYDVSGRKVKEIEENIKKGKNKFKISGLKKGVYFIEVNFNEKLKKFKIIKI